MSKDYYLTLGVPHTASESVIKKAYRMLALKYHPDKNLNNIFAESQFKEIQEAYSIIGNPLKRKNYDYNFKYNKINYSNPQPPIVTPEWLLNICLELNKSLTKMSANEIDNRNLKAYILLILSNEHCTMLLKNKDETIKNNIILEILKALQKLHYLDVHEIQSKLILLATSNVNLTKQITQNIAIKEKKYKYEKSMPFYVIITTVILCIFIYIYSHH